MYSGFVAFVDNSVDCADFVAYGALMKSEILKVSEVAKRVGVSASAVRTWCQRGEPIPDVAHYYKTPGGHWRLVWTGQQEAA